MPSPKPKKQKDCPNCGLRLPAEAKTCQFCGWDFEEEDDWTSEIEQLEKELLVKGKKAEEPRVAEMIDSSMRDSTSGKHEAPAEHKPKAQAPSADEASFSTLVCPTCGSALGGEEEFCPSCGADLKEEQEWASEIEELEAQLQKKRKVDSTSIESMIESTIRSPVSGQPEEPAPPQEPEPEEAAEQPLEPSEAEESGLKCPACGGRISSSDGYCHLCGADLGEEDWAEEVEALEKELLSKRKVFEEPPLEELEEEEPEPLPAIPAPEIEEAAKESAAQAEYKEPEFFEFTEEKPKMAEEPPVPPKEIRPTPPPQELPAPPVPLRTDWAKGRMSHPSLGRVNGLRKGMVNGTKRGMINGTKKGMINGTKRGMINGTKKGMVNGTKRGMVNGTQKGLVNGTRQGMVNGTKQGKVNGIAMGRVNGLKGQAQMGEQKPPRFFSRNGPMFRGRRMFVVIVVFMLILSSAVVFFIYRNHGFAVDGNFSDWSGVPAYSFSTLIPGEVLGIDDAKMNYTQYESVNRLFLYADLQDDIFSGNNVSTLYVLIDMDANAATGYSSEGALGADTLLMLAGWNGSIQDTARSTYNATTDKHDWSSWQPQSGVYFKTSGSEIEFAVNVQSIAPLVQLVTYIEGKESRSPVMSMSGTILARQQSLISDSLASSASPSVLRVKAVAMGIKADSLTLHASLVDNNGQHTPATDIIVTSSAWTTKDFTVDLSSLSLGDGFKYDFSATSSGFQGAIDISGDSGSGYLLQYPTNIVVDGLFEDWDTRKLTDSDPAPVENPRIDIKEYGVASQGGSYFMYTGTAGNLFDGADVPEERIKPSEGQGGGPIVRLRKTGEDLFQAFIDRDPGSGIGKVVWAGGDYIRADLVVEVFGRDGAVTSESVNEWSAADNKWLPLGVVESIAVGTGGVELSVRKMLLGNLSASEIFFFTTDWKARSDNCMFNSPLVDPWAVRGSPSSSDSYYSNDGISWTNAGSIPLESGDRVVALAHSLDRSYVFAVTNSGRVYDWEVNADTTWGPDVTGPCNSTEVVGIAPNSASGEGGCLILGANGWTWTTASIGGARGWTNCTSKVAQGAYDFRDVCYNSTGGRYWAVRSGANTPAYYSSTLGSWSETNPTGSPAAHSHVYHIGDSDTGSPGSEQVFVLCEDGNISYSADGGATWALRGNLTAPGKSGLPLYSIYVAIDRDSSGMFWAITNTSYCFNSSDRGEHWDYRGNIGVKDIASLACPEAFIPEFGSLIVPVSFAAAIVFAIRLKKRMRPEMAAEDEGSE